MIESSVRPYYLQPDKLWPFLSFERQKWPSSVNTEFYLSFEDALWSLLPRLGYKKGSILLIPEFYCPDVINNIEAHGYSVKIYPCNKDLSIDIKKTVSIIGKIKPDVFVDFAPAGVPTGIADAVYRKLPFHSLVILDRVHSLIDPSPDFFPQTDRFLLLNSYRKVSPLPGSLAVFSRNARPASRMKWTRYLVKGYLYWVSYQLNLRLSRILRITSLAMHAAERQLQCHDDHIGNAESSTPLPRLFARPTEYLAIAKVKQTKQEQASYYRGIFQGYEHRFSKNMWPMMNVDQYLTELRGYPLILKEPYATRFINECRSKGLLVIAQLEDSIWSKTQKLVLLPLGPHLSMNDVRKIATIAEKALTSVL
jgi:hypothetical protein